jgi:hypothetical protein
MSRPFTESDFSTQINEDRTWRLKEISDLKDAIKRADERLQRVLLRSLVTICYAHWEGYIRFASRRYLDYVSLRKFKYAELNPQFLRNYFLPRLAALSVSKASISDRCDLINDILAGGERRFSHYKEDLINTGSNLNSEVFADICLVCGIGTPFLDKTAFVDIVLLKRRNQIAHGENTFVELEDVDTLSDETIALMRSFGDLLENRVVLQEYKRSPQYVG